MSAYADEERRIVLLRVFRAYDDERKGLLEVEAFSNLIADLHSFVSATGSASVVMKDKPEHLGATNGHVTLDNLYTIVKTAPVHCDGKQTSLLQVLVANADKLIDLHANRIGGGTTFAYKKVLACQEPLPYTGLDIKFELAVGGGHKTACIPDPMQTWMSIPTFDENVRVFASRGDDVSPGGSLASKVIKNWPSGGKAMSPSEQNPVIKKAKDISGATDTSYYAQDSPQDLIVLGKEKPAEQPFGLWWKSALPLLQKRISGATNTSYYAQDSSQDLIVLGVEKPAEQPFGVWWKSALPLLQKREEVEQKLLYTPP